MTNRLRSILKATLLLLPIILVISLVACKPTCDHTWGDWQQKDAATCETAGVQTRTCTECGEAEAETVNPLGHQFTTYQNNNDANCQKNATETAKCTRCNATDTREIPNSKNASVHASDRTRYIDSPLDGKHSKNYTCCNALIELSEHRWDAGVPDTTDPSTTVYTCEDCAATKKVTASGHEHDFELTESHSATCEQPGYNLYSCVCGESDVEYTAPANGHDVDSWQLSSETKKSGEECVYLQTWCSTCFVCRQDVERQTEATRHTYQSTITKSPTCQTAGEKTYSCVCGATPETATEVIPADSHAHAWDGGVTSSGITTYTCQNNGCHAVKTAKIYYYSPSFAMDPALLESNEIVLGDVSLKVDQTLLGNIDMYTLVSLTAKPITGADRDALISALPEALRSQISSSTPIMDFGLVQNGTDVDFNGGTVRITMKYNLPEGADADCITVWYIDSDGNLSYYVAHYYEVGEGDEKQGYIWFDAEHFSPYMPGIAPSEDACDVYTHLWETTVVDPTCTTRGYTEYHCQRCGESKIGDVITALGHSYEVTEMIPSTCQTAGSRTMVCTRDDCAYEQTVTLALASHAYEYDSSKSTPVTCTQDGVVIYSCTVPGCDASKEYDRYEAWGHGNYRETSAALVTAGTKCTAGVVITYQCGNEDYLTGRCTHTYEVIVYEHVNEYSFPNNKENYDPRDPQRIMLGSYLTAAGISYTEEPYLEISAGCLCGEQGSELRLFGGTSESGETLLGTYSEPLYRANDCPYPGTTLYETEFYATGFSWSPETGPMQTTWTIRFCPKLVQDGCTYTYSVDVYLGYNQDGTYTDTFNVELATYDVHTDVVKTATVDDPTKSCYYNCNVGSEFVYGIHVTETCTLCGEVTDQFDTAVSTSSSHYYITEEVYEGPNGFEVYIRTCPCGSTRCDDGRWDEYRDNHDGVRCVEYGNYSYTKTTETVSGRSLTVYTCTYNGEVFIYAVEAFTYYDAEKCKDAYYQMLYLNCASAEDYTNCEKTVKCEQSGTYRHHYESETVDIPVDGNPCYVNKVTTSTCVGSCGETIVSENLVAIHVPTTTTVTDATGNTTTTSYCENCGYYELNVTDTYGNVLRTYSEALIVRDGQIYHSVIITIYTWVDGELQPTFERGEIYEDATKEVCIEWNETVRQYYLIVEPEKGCFKSVITTVSSSRGYYYVFEDGWRNCCQFGDIESKVPTCEELGYERRTCSVCGYVEYLFGPEYGEHDLWSTEPEWQERNCLQDGYERRYCAICDYYEELYYDPSYGHVWMSDAILNSDGSATIYVRCDMCGAYSTEGAPSHASVDVMSYGMDGSIYVVKYVNRANPDAAEIYATCEVVAFFSTEDEWGNTLLLLNEDGTPKCTVLDVAVQDDGNGALFISYDGVPEASDGLKCIGIFLAVRTDEGTVTYVMLG